MIEIALFAAEQNGVANSDKLPGVGNTGVKDAVDLPRSTVRPFEAHGNQATMFPARALYADCYLFHS